MSHAFGHGDQGSGHVARATRQGLALDAALERPGVQDARADQHEGDVGTAGRQIGVGTQRRGELAERAVPEVGPADRDDQVRHADDQVPRQHGLAGRLDRLPGVHGIRGGQPKLDQAASTRAGTVAKPVWSRISVHPQRDEAKRAAQRVPLAQNDAGEPSLFQ